MILYHTRIKTEAQVGFFITNLSLRQTDRPRQPTPTDRHTHTDRDSQRDRRTETASDTDRPRQPEIQRDRPRQPEIQTDRDNQSDRQTETNTQPETETETDSRRLKRKPKPPVRARASRVFQQRCQDNPARPALSVSSLPFLRAAGPLPFSLWVTGARLVTGSR